MMSKFFKYVLVAVFCVAGYAQAEGQIVFLDVQEVFKSFYKTELAQDQIRKLLDDFEQEKADLDGEVETLKSDIELLRAAARDEELSEDERANKRDLLEEKLVALQEKEQEVAEFEEIRKGQIQQQNSRMSKMIYDEIQATVIDYAKMHDYASVIDSSSQSRAGSAVVMYVNPQVDITAEILQVLNEGQDKEEE